MTSRFYVTRSVLGRRAWCVASVHGTENTALADPEAFISYWASLFDLGHGQQKPRYINKVDDDIGGAGVGAQIKHANTYGFETITQLRDDETASRGIEAGYKMAEHLLDIGFAFGVLPAQFGYSNEMDDKWSDLTPDEGAHIVLSIYDRLRGRGVGFTIGQVASWGDAVKFAAAFRRQAADFPKMDIRSFGIHQYRGRPGIPFHLGVPEMAKRLSGGMGIPIENHETDLSFMPDGEALGIHDYRGAVYALANNLEHAALGIPCCDFTLQNATGVPLGNGMFKTNGDPWPSGEALRDIGAPFTASPLLQVFRSQQDAFTVAANAAGQLVVTCFGEAALTNADLAFRQSMFGQRANWVTTAQLLAFLAGSPPPSAPPDVIAPNWTRIKDIYDQSVLDEVAEYRVAEIALPFTPSSVSIKKEFNDGTNAAEVSLRNHIVVVKMWKYGAVYLEVD